jgi:hypothetical protein
VSENGPREGTKDLPRRNPESGQRSVDPNSPSGRAYRRLARSEQRRRTEIAELVRAGLSFDAIVARYAQDHPAEREVTADEVRSARPE